MADLTSSLTITGSIGGRKITYAHVYTMEDVYDAGCRTSGFFNQDSPYGSLSAGGGALNFPQDTPNYLMARNASGTTPMTADITLAGGAVIRMALLPGQMAVIHGTTGMANASAVAATATLLDAVSLGVGSMGFYGHGQPQLYVAFNAVT